MNKTTIKFLKPGLQTLIQDHGRGYHRAQGVPVGGTLDESSAIIANKLVGNMINSPVLEITISGPEILFTGDDCLVAITGADISPTINGNQVEMYRSIAVAENSVLSFGKLNNGCRAYLSIKGNWQVQKWLGSVSAIFRDLHEITPDSFITKGSDIKIMHDGKFKGLIYPISLRPALNDAHEIRVLSGPETSMFSDETLEKFFSLAHNITPSSNRWGYRLDTKILSGNPGQEIISSGVFPGTIQIPHSGQPIILMADAQTTGGYPRIAVVISADMDRLAQAKPGDALRFRVVDRSEALSAMEIRDRQLSLL